MSKHIDASDEYERTGESGERDTAYIKLERQDDAAYEAGYAEGLKAKPMNEHIENVPSYPFGMTEENWRHEVAARAMEGWVSAYDNPPTPALVAQLAYKLADALIEEGKKVKP